MTRDEAELRGDEATTGEEQMNHVPFFDVFTARQQEDGLRVNIVSNLQEIESEP
jgi:hypothetical protein